MGMKHILRALDQALETAEVERKYLRDELEAERGGKAAPGGGAGAAAGSGGGTQGELDKLLETFRERERTWAGEREDMAGKLREMRREKERMQGAVDSLESENAKLREALENRRNHADQGTWAVTRTCATPTAGKRW